MGFLTFESGDEAGSAAVPVRSCAWAACAGHDREVSLVAGVTMALNNITSSVIVRGRSRIHSSDRNEVQISGLASATKRRLSG
jgi:hypothetical protein